MIDAGCPPLLFFYTLSGFRQLEATPPYGLSATRRGGGERKLGQAGHIFGNLREVIEHDHIMTREDQVDRGCLGS